MRLIPLIAATALAACSPPSNTASEAPPRPETPQVAACNNVAPDLNKLVSVQNEVVTAAAALADLSGGRIVPGLYDLTSATRIGGATGWAGQRAVSLDVTESNGAVVFNWAGAAASGEVDTWTANFTDTPQVRLTYTCGRMGDVEGAFTAEPNELTLRLTDGASGALLLGFERRG
ncbi:hypothetical protein U91I_02004 [alpha proteobacterium U9-1i]|nr:hypothetical protein U91I_02004 [alpha proteobacterium U9-1i]